MKRTMGHWKIVGESTLNIISTETTKGRKICSIICTSDEDRANADLIATAPELLRELKSAIFYIETYGGEVTSNFSSSGNLNAVKAIIKKAEGEGK